MASYNVEINYLNENNEYDQLFPSSLPKGIISLWYGAINDIPNGWVLCNGSNGTPDLRNRFVVGAGSSYNVGSTGGSNTVTLTTNQIPSHNHAASTSTTTNTTVNTKTTVNGNSNAQTDAAGEHFHEVYSGGVTAGNLRNAQVDLRYTRGSDGLYTTSAGSHTHTISGLTFNATSTSTANSISTSTTTISNTGSGSSHENRPPYYALCYIMKT